MAKLDIQIPNLKLNDGRSIPMLGYGNGTAWYKRGDLTKTDHDLIAITKKAIEMGYTHLDSAESYNTEAELGTAIKESGIDRSSLFVTTKVSKSFDDIKARLKRALELLQLDYVDLYLIHEPFDRTEEKLQREWAEMEELQVAGLAKSIGVSNYSPKHLEVLLQTAKVIPAVNQIEFNPYLQSPDWIEFHKAHGITTAAYSPLAPVAAAAPGPIDTYLAALRKKYAVSSSEILLRWCLDQDIVPITTSGKEQRLSDYLRCATFKLTPAEIKEIRELGTGKHSRTWFKKRYPNENN